MSIFFIASVFTIVICTRNLLQRKFGDLCFRDIPRYNYYERTSNEHDSIYCISKDKEREHREHAISS